MGERGLGRGLCTGVRVVCVVVVGGELCFDEGFVFDFFEADHACDLWD